MTGRALTVAVWILASHWPLVAAAQDSTVVERGVRVGITYRPGTRPGIAVLPSPSALDSLRTVIQRDLDYSDLFEVVPLLGGDSLVPRSGGDRAGGLNYPLFRALGADFAVEVAGSSEAPRLVVHRVAGGAVVRELSTEGVDLSSPAGRLRAHALADEIVRATVGAAGIATTRLLFVQGQRIWQVDADGAAVHAVTPSGVTALSPVWSPDGRRVAYMTLEREGQGRLLEQPVDGGPATPVSGTGAGLNLTPEYSPDGSLLAFARSGEGQTDVYIVRIRERCCLQRLTVGRFSDNLSPAFSPDGARVAFISTRAGVPQLYVMASDGTGQEVFAPFDYGATGASYAPAWSPDGQWVAFHRVVGETPQIFVLDVRTRSVRQLTSTGRNEDPTWAPDSRHLAFVSDRTGSRQLWVIDLETGRVRQLTRVGATRLPAWSPTLAADLTTP